jgi:hypothetical protein
MRDHQKKKVDELNFFAPTPHTPLPTPDFQKMCIVFSFSGMWVTVLIKTHQFLIKNPAAPNPPYTISDFMITRSAGEL